MELEILKANQFELEMSGLPTLISAYKLFIARSLATWISLRWWALMKCLPRFYISLSMQVLDVRCFEDCMVEEHNTFRGEVISIMIFSLLVKRTVFRTLNVGGIYDQIWQGMGAGPIVGDKNESDTSRIHGGLKHLRAFIE